MDPASRELASVVLAVGLAAVGAMRAEPDPRTVVGSATASVRAGNAAAHAAQWRRTPARGDSARAAALALATVERLTYAYDSAEHRYRGLFVAPGAAADSYDIHARIGLGLGLEAQGRSGGDVADLYRDALHAARALRDSTTMGEALFRLGSLLAPLGGTGPGLAYIDSSLMVLPASAGDLRATARCRRAQYFVATVRPGAGDTLKSATMAARATGDPDALGYCLRGWTVLHRLSGSVDSAVTAAAELIDLRRRSHDRSGLATALVVRGDIVRTRGHFGQANRDFREALVEARASRNRFIEATVSLALGATALLLNDHAMAGEHIERAIRSYETSNDSASLMFALSYRPFVSMAAGDLAKARAQTVPLIAYWTKYGDLDHLNDLHRQRAVIEMRAGDYAAAGRALDDAAVVARQLRSPGQLGAVEYERGRLALRRGDLDRAERGFMSYRATLDSSERLPRHDVQVRLAEVYARRGDLARAEKQLADAGAELDAWRRTLADVELRTLAFQASAFEANDRNAAIAGVLAALAGGGHATAAFDLAERRRARELAEGMARARALRELPTEGSDDGTVDPSPVPSAMPAAAIAHAIPDDSTAIVEFVTAPGGARTTMFMLTRGLSDTGVVTARILASADSLVGDIARLVALVESGDDPATLARSLGAAVLDPLVSALPAVVSRLVIIPDGPLHRMPWDVLRLADGRYAAERYAIGIAPSATIAATAWASAPRVGSTQSRAPLTEPSRGARVLAFGDPYFGGGPVADGAGSDGTDPGAAALPRLPGSEREARLAARYGASAEVRLGEDATAVSLKSSALSQYDVLHFATHALVDDRIAARSVLVLGANGDESGFLGPADLAALDLDASLVVLSACRSAGGVIVDGEGIQGLTAPLLEAGARSVVATAWRISDRATVPFIEAFYDAMANGSPVGDALHAAKLDAIRRGAPPREWAAFSVVGDPLARVSLVKPRQRPTWTILLTVLFVAALTSFSVVRMRGRRST